MVEKDGFSFSALEPGSQCPDPYNAIALKNIHGFPGTISLKFEAFSFASCKKNCSLIHKPL
jgi:hypothetical protein